MNDAFKVLKLEMQH